LWPRIDLELAATRNNNLNGVRGPNNDETAMLRLRYNLFQGGADVARVNAARYRVREANELLNQTRRAIDENVRLAFNAYMTANDRLPHLAQQVSASDLTRDAYHKQFTIGQRTLLDVLNAESEYSAARGTHITGQYVQLYATYR